MSIEESVEENGRGREDAVEAGGIERMGDRGGARKAGEGTAPLSSRTRRIKVTCSDDVFFCSPYSHR